MQTSLVKRSLMTLLESGPMEKGKYYKEPQKKVKANLKIEISDSFVENCEPLAVSTSRGSHSKISFRPSLSLQTCKASTSTSTTTSPQFSTRHSSAFDFTKQFVETDTSYDNFYKEDDFYNITMKKCHRRNMEDRAVIETPFETHSRNSFFGIYDGHRNSYTSDFLQRNLHKMLFSHPELYNHPEKAFKETFCKIDQDVCRNQERLNLQGGSTAMCAMMDSTGMLLANAGDSKAVVVRGGQAFALNIEHRANNEEEKKRVENRGGFVFEKKSQNTSRFLVQGALELTRSIGDISYKQYISAEPEVFQYKFDKNDDYILLASDGFWNELNEKDVTELIQSFGKTKGLSKYLVEEILKKKEFNIDNITLIVVDLKKYAEMAQE